MGSATSWSDLPLDGSSREFEGYPAGGVGVTFILVEARPGLRLHRPPHAEAFVVQDRRATFAVGDETVEAAGGRVMVVPVGGQHRFVDPKGGTPRQVDTHDSDGFVAGWLEG